MSHDFQDIYNRCFDIAKNIPANIPRSDTLSTPDEEIIQEFQDVPGFDDIPAKHREILISTLKDSIFLHRVVDHDINRQESDATTDQKVDWSHVRQYSIPFPDRLQSSSEIGRASC